MTKVWNGEHGCSGGGRSVWPVTKGANRSSEDADDKVNEERTYGIPLASEKDGQVSFGLPW